MEKQANIVQNYIDEINKVNNPNDKENILDFLGTLDNPMQKRYLSFILSQSHIFNNMINILDTYTNNDFYFNADYIDRHSRVVPKLDKEGKVCYEEAYSAEDTAKACRTILQSLQNGDKTIWKQFVKYVKSIYEPDKMDIFHNNELNLFSSELSKDFMMLQHEITNNDILRNEINELNNKPVIQQNGFINRIKGFFSERKREKEIRKKEKVLQDDSCFSEKALALIDKYKNNKNTTNIMKKQFELAEKIIKAGVSKEDLVKILMGLRECASSSSLSNYKIADMMKQLSINAQIGKKLYSPEILYASTFQDMTQNIRKLLMHVGLEEEKVPITTEYRTKPLKNGFLATEDISNVLKGKNLSQEEIKTKMAEFDEEFKEMLEEKNPETYVRRCTNLMMRFVSTHPFDDGNGRTSRMLLQSMLARRGILLPSTIDNYFERQTGTEYCLMEDSCLRTQDSTKMENYILERVTRFNDGKLQLNDEPLIFPAKERNIDLEQSIAKE